MAKWHKTIEDNDDDQENDNNEQLTPEEITWKKRYADLRSHSQKKENEINDRVKTLEVQLAEAAKNNIKLPKTPEEIKEWATTYPDVAATVRTIAMEENNASRAEIDKLREEIKEESLKNARDKATMDLDRLHPDFFTVIRDSEEFEAWLQTKSKRIRDALYENDTDAESAGDVVTLYKAETGYKSGKKINPRDAAKDVRINNRPDSPNLNNEMQFSESQINKMSVREYEENEPAIDKAMREGKVLMDVTGGAR